MPSDSPKLNLLDELPLMRRLRLALIILALAGSISFILVNITVASYSTDRIYESVDAVPSNHPVAIVLGARVENDGTPSNTLHDRTLVGAELYKAGKVKTLLMSGGGREPEVMKKLAVELGVAEPDIVLDQLGLRTYESCVRAKQVFGLDKAIVVTQDYHLARTLYLCRNLGVDAVGVNAKRREYLGERWSWVREYLSRVAAWYDINFRKLPAAPEEKHPIGE